MGNKKHILNHDNKKREKIVKTFCRRMEKWESINDICISENIAYKSIKYRIDGNEYFRDLWTNSKDLYVENKVNEILQYVSYGLSLWSAASKFGISKSTIYNRIDKNNIYKELLEIAEWQKNYIVESARYKQIIAGNTTILMKEMLTIHKDKYQETTKVDMSVKSEETISDDRIIEIAKMIEMRKRIREEVSL